MTSCNTLWSFLPCFLYFYLYHTCSLLSSHLPPFAVSFPLSSDFLPFLITFSLSVSFPGFYFVYMFYLHFLSFHLDNFLDAFCFYLPSISFLSTYPSFSVPLCILILQFYEHVAMQTQLHSLNSGTSDIRSVTLKFGPY